VSAVSSRHPLSLIIQKKKIEASTSRSSKEKNTRIPAREIGRERERVGERERDSHTRVLLISSVVSTHN